MFWGKWEWGRQRGWVLRSHVFMEGRNSSVMLRLVSVESQSDQLMTSLPTSHFRYFSVHCSIVLVQCIFLRSSNSFNMCMIALNQTILWTVMGVGNSQAAGRGKVTAHCMHVMPCSSWSISRISRVHIKVNFYLSVTVHTPNFYVRKIERF